MPIAINTAVEIVKSITTGSDLPADYPETLVLHALGARHLDDLESEMLGRSTCRAEWVSLDALRTEMSALFPMVLEPCDAHLAARRCEWYAKVLRACA